MLHANLMALSFTEAKLWAIKVYIAGTGILDVFGTRWPTVLPGDILNVQL